MKRRRSRWANLSTELLRLVAEYLKDDPDNVNNFRLTCKNWWQSTTASIILPLRVNSNPQRKLYFSAVCLLRRGTRGDVPATAYSPWMVSAVESTKGDIQFCHPFSKTPLLSWCRSLSDQFQSTQLASAYHLTHADEQDRDHPVEFDKVLLISKHRIPSADGCGLLALHNGGRLGGYLSFKNQNDDDDDELVLPWIEIKYRSISRFDDIIMYNGMIVALNRQGKLYTIDGNKLEIISTLVDCAIAQDGRPSYRGCRRRCVTSPTGKLYLVERVSHCLLKVYKLSDEKYGRKWIEVKSLGDKVLFVTRDCCFFVSASEFSTCSLNNCIVFSNDAFPKYGRTVWELPDPSKSGSEIYVFRVGGDSEYNFKSISSFTGFPLLLWSCPPWIWDAGSSSSQVQREEEEEEEGEEDEEREEEEVTESDANSEDGASPASSEPEPEPMFVEQFVEAPSTSAIQGNISRDKTPLSFMNEQEPVPEEVMNRETLREENNITHSVSRGYITSQCSKSDNSTVKFKGLDVRASLLQTLQNIWSKHGNLIKDSIIRNGDLVSRALESLATAVIILKETSASSLSDFQIDYLNSTLSDLQFMHFKVDWLAPYVEKAVQLHKSKPLMDSRDELIRCQAKVVERRSKLLEELSKLNKLEKELEEDVANVSKLIPFSGNVDLDQPIGCGLS